MVTLKSSQLLVTGGKIKKGAVVKACLLMVDRLIEIAIIVEDGSTEKEDPLRIRIGEIGGGVLDSSLNFAKDIFYLNPKDMDIETIPGQNLMDNLAEIAFFRSLGLVRFDMWYGGTQVSLKRVAVSFRKSSVAFYIGLEEDDQEKSTRYFVPRT